jgi:protein arginine kinase
VKLDDLIVGPSPWLQPGGPQSDIILSTRVRLARNVAGRPFSSRLTPEQREELEAWLKKAILKSLEPKAVAWFELEGMPDIDRRCLVERHLISRELAGGEGHRGTHRRCGVVPGEDRPLDIRRAGSPRGGRGGQSRGD